MPRKMDTPSMSATLLLVASWLLIFLSTPCSAGRSMLAMSAGQTALHKLSTSQQLEDQQLSGQQHGKKKARSSIKVPETTSQGYLTVNKSAESSMFYLYYEAREPAGDLSTLPILLWLQGGPGCSSIFGMLYINGPYFINNDLTLRENPGSWNRQYGMLFIEQPLGVGYSQRGQQAIPKDELQVAADLYHALQSFYRAHPHYRKRPLVITGESYAGKYVPSISHYILEATACAQGFHDKLKHSRFECHEEPDYPVFELGGLAIGNGFTDAESQTKVQAEVAYNMGLINWGQRREAEKMQDQIIEYVRSREWKKARQLSDQLLAYITEASGSAILEDVRRNIPYDGLVNITTEAYMNQPHVKQAMGAPPNMEWISCSHEVDEVLSGDVMRSTKNLVIDLLAHHPALLYQGQWDAECGVASNDAWISTMTWDGHRRFASAPREKLWVNGRIAYYWKKYSTLSHVVIRNTGHMIPHDNPLYGQYMIEKWLQEDVRNGTYTRETSIAEERDWIPQDQGDQANTWEFMEGWAKKD